MKYIAKLGIAHVRFHYIYFTNIDLPSEFVDQVSISCEDSGYSEIEFIDEDEFDPEFKPESPPKRNRIDDVYITFERKKEIIDLWEKHPGWSWKSLKANGAKEIPDQSRLYQWKKEVQNPSKLQKFRMINKDVYEQLKEARKSYKILRSSHLRAWALQKCQEFNDSSFQFKASKTWLDRFKSSNRISSRKINQLISKREVKSAEEILNSAKKFQLDIRSISNKYPKDHILNTDQCGFSYELTSQRTYTHKGEKIVYGYAQSPKNLITHSYTVQYLINMEGHIVGNVFVCLQETGGKMGPTVKKDVESYLPSNVTLTCSTSGKLSTSLNEYFIEKQVVPFVTNDFLYIVDSWTGHTNIDSYSKYSGVANDRPEITLKVIPEKCTPLAQPLDTTFHRQLKYLAREILACLEVFINIIGINPKDNWTPRQGALRLQSLLHLMMSAPIFQPMIKYAWFSSGLSEEKEDFLNVKQACFTFENGESNFCEIPDCNNPRFIKCARCRKRVCIFDFWISNHFNFCESNPFH